MIFPEKNVVQQVEDLLHLYDGLRISSEDEIKISLVGDILVNRTALGFTLFKTYQIEVVIPLISEELPYVFDRGNHIESSYPHRYTDGRLCLETDTHIKVRFADGFSLETWMSEYVETYFFSYEFYQRYGIFPFGERGHGWDGVFQTYSDLFGETDQVKVLRLMRAISSCKYRGHSLCPCGSGRNLRSCHGAQTMKYYTDDRLKRIVQSDYRRLEEEIKQYNGQQ